ncbi:MAG TPA: hypothetical protein VFA32_20075 [Dehalococcoidia bacterium]|nr:hypothetical protein [Dehalococcoidia bacterium]
MERQIQAIEKLMQGQEFDSLEDMNTFLQETVDQGEIHHVPTTPFEQAQELVYQAWESSSPRQRRRLARQALEIFPDCADALVILAEEAKGPTESWELYRQAVNAGERSLGPEIFTDGAGHFWGIVETRPYMRAREGLAQSLWGMGALGGAVEHYREMLRLNPNDNQGLRYQVLQCLFSLEDLAGIEELLAQYPDEFTATWLFSRALVSYLQSGDSHQSREALVRAVDENPHVVPYLLGKERLPRRLPEYMGWGDQSEAMHYVAMFGPEWRKNRWALAWLEANQEYGALDIENLDTQNGNNGATLVPLPGGEDGDLSLDSRLELTVEEEEYVAPSEEDWRALYQAAVAFRNALPWAWMDDGDLFAVENPADGQLGYCIVMGGGGREFGLAVFVGPEGLESYRRLESGEVDPESFEATAMLRSLSVTFVGRSHLEKPDLATIRSLGLRFRGNNTWPLFRSQHPGWLPWLLNQAEAQFLALALEQSLEIVRQVKDDDLALIHEVNEELVLTRTCGRRGWRQEWRKPEKPVPPDQSLSSIDPGRLEDLRQRTGQPSGTWELDMFLLPATLAAESGRPYFPNMVLAVERTSGLVTGLGLSGPAPGVPVQQETVLRMLERAGHLPRHLRVASDSVRESLDPLAKALSISVRVSVLPALEEAKEKLCASMLNEDFL